jgi:LacI family transcriptional regulator
MALRDHPEIALATRKRVKKIAVQMGYKVHPYVRALMSTVRVRSVLGQPILALLNAWPDRRALHLRDFQRLLISAIVARAHALGFSVEEHWLHEPGMTGSRLSDILHARGIDGIVIPGVPPSSASNLKLKWERFAVVACGRSVKSPDFHRAAPALYDSMRLAVRAVVGSGRKRLGLVLSPEVDEMQDEQWTGAFLAAQRKWDRKSRLPTLSIEPAEKKVFFKWLEEYRPDAIITSLNYLPVHEWLKAAPPHLAEGVQLVELFRSGKAEGCPRVDANGELIGAAAVDLLISQILRDERGIPQYRNEVLVPATWVDSPGPAAKSSR